MNQTFEQIVELLVNSLNIKDQELSNSARDFYRTGATAFIAALNIDLAKGEGDDVSGQVAGLISIASLFQNANAPETDAQALKAAIDEVVIFPGNQPLEIALQNSFRAIYDGTLNGRKFSALINAYNPPDEDGE